MSRKEPDPIDVHVGNAIRARRMQLRYSQANLGDHLGLTFQQVQKYEKGTNRVGSSNLQRIAAFLQCTPASFFPTYTDLLEGPVINDPFDAMRTDRSGIALAQVWVGLPREMRECLLTVAKAISPNKQETSIEQR